MKATAFSALPVSRRDFCRGTIGVSSLAVAGIPLRALAAGARTSPHVPADVRVSHDGYASHMEPCLAVNPRQPRHLLAACDLGTLLGTYASFDGGLTWLSNGPLPMPAGVAGGTNLSAGFTGTGRGLVCGLLVASGSGGGKGGLRGVYVWRTDDHGRTFTPPVAVAGYGPGTDRPWLATERGRPQAVHVVWTEGSSLAGDNAVGYARSADGGQTFEAPRTIASMARGLGDAMVACGPPGCVYVIYGAGHGVGGAITRQTAGTRPQTPMTATVICSRDAGQTFGPPIKLGRGTINVSFPGVDSGSDSLPAIAADPRTGLVGAVFTVHRAGASHGDILLAASRDAGRTWSPATAITPPDHRIYFQPQVAIDDAGRIGVMAFAMAKGLVSVVLMVSRPGSLRFAPPITVTSQPFNPAQALGPRWRLGNYQALATTPGAFHPLWNDPRTGTLELFTAAVRNRK